MNCDRCDCDYHCGSMSIFNTQMCCPPCLLKEKAHPDFEYARKVESDAVQAGNYNHPGVGWPGKDERVTRTA